MIDNKVKKPRHIVIIESGVCHYEIIPSQLCQILGAFPGCKITLSVSDLRQGAEALQIAKRNISNHYFSAELVNLSTGFELLRSNAHEKYFCAADMIIVNGIGQPEIVMSILSITTARRQPVNILLHGKGCAFLFNEITARFPDQLYLISVSCLDAHAFRLISPLATTVKYKYMLSPFNLAGCNSYASKLDLRIITAQLNKKIEILQKLPFRACFGGHINEKHGYSIAFSLETLIRTAKIRLKVVGHYYSMNEIKASGLCQCIYKGLIGEMLVNNSKFGRTREIDFVQEIESEDFLIKHIEANSDVYANTSGLVAISRTRLLPLVIPEGYLEPYPAIRYKDETSLARMIDSEDFVDRLYDVKRLLAIEALTAWRNSICEYQAMWLDYMRKESHNCD